MVRRLVHSADPQHESRALELLSHAQRLGNMGWAEWDLESGEALWSDHLYVIFGRSRAQGPIRLHELPAHVDSADAQTLDRLLWKVTREPEPVQAEFRVRRDGGVRNVRAVLERVEGKSGRVGVHGLIQDITSRRRAERIVSQSRRELSEAREQAAVDRQVTLAMRDAILPQPGTTVELPHSRIAVRYVPAEKTANLGGDWYEAAPLPDGRVLLAIGDVAGHGLEVIAQMAQLRHALLGLSMTGRPADLLLSWLNDLVRHRLDGTTATAIVGHLDPASGGFVWSQAGNLPPVLVREGVARRLRPPDGLLLGVDEWAYEQARITLRPDDVLLMFTDGLVERRHRDIDEGLAHTLTAAAKLRPASLEEDLDRLLEEIGGPNPEDDACLLAVHMREFPPRRRPG
ncbi:PP2C family protein-serine/threonine phosphatase [Thermocatellispora tengchongensis]